MKKLIIASALILNGLPRHFVPCNDKVHNRHCEAKPRQSGASGYKSTQAFSLIELLISLIIISVITAAFTPIIIKKFQKGDIAITQGGIVSYNSKTFTDDAEWEVPTRVRRIKVTSIAGGGAGGGASFGSKEITSTQTWVVPNGVTKLKVYMTGAGGGGANGIQGSPYVAAIPGTPAGSVTKYGNLPSLGSNTVSITTAGTYTFSDITPPATYKAPALASGCTGNWNYNGASVAPGGYVSTYSNNAIINITNITACGGGGSKASSSGTNYSAGGRGGYSANNSVSLNGNVSNIQLVVGNNGSAGIPGNNATSFAGGAGGSGIHSGSKGTNGSASPKSINCYAVGGGGGGGSTGILNTNGNILFEIAGGGGPGGSAGSSAEGCKSSGGKGGSGGGTNPGLGGSGASCSNDHVCSAGGGATGYVKGSKGGTLSTTSISGGGTGGGGIGATSSTIFGSNNCNAGKPGAIQLTYSVAALANALTCTAPTAAVSGTPAIPAVDGRGGGGGGAGQVFVGEIPVTQGQTVTFTIGTGGGSASVGGNTTIAVNGTVKATALGGNAGNGTSGGAARGLNSTNNWLNISSSSGASGSNGSGGTGGTGGGTYSKTNSYFSGGPANTAAPTTNYGTGGGGGNATQTSRSLGSKGANGYIYVEYMSANGGGGASGEVVQLNSLGVTPGDKVKIKVANGGAAPNVTNPSTGIYSGSNGNSGGDSYITIAGVNYAYAKGGLGGLAGTSTQGTGGACPNASALCSKGDNASSIYGGMGGSITSTLCSICDPLRGLGGCGGNMPSGSCYNPLPTPYGKAATVGGGGGGGGGAVSSGVAYSGGYGAKGSVVIEWN